MKKHQQRDWTVNWVVVKMRQQGYSWRAIGKTLGYRFTSVKDMYSRWKDRVEQEEQSFSSPAVFPFLPAESPMTPYEVLDQKEIEEAVVKAEKRLTARQYIALTLRAQGLSWGKMGKFMGVTRVAAKYQYINAVRVMCRELGRAGFSEISELMNQKGDSVE